MVLAGEFVVDELFSSYDKIVIPKEDEYSANCILVNDFVIIPAGYPATKQKIEQAGFSVIELPMSEFQKQDGGLSCLSLRF
jgi:dimethylargininase